MNYLLSKKWDGTFTINFIGTDALTFPTGNTLKLVTTNTLTAIKDIYLTGVTIDGVNSYQYINFYFKYKNIVDSDTMKCGDCWSDLIPLEHLSGMTFSETVPFNIEIYVYRIDEPPFDNLHPRTPIYISNLTLYGHYDLNYTDGAFSISGVTESIILKPKDIYKVFSVDDFQIIGNLNIDNLDIKYRVTQNDGRTFSQWEKLTKENISTYKFNELRFAQIQYLITPKTNDPEPANIYDIILIGDFQNISANYLKTNRYGLREDCLTTYLASTGITEICGMNVSTNDVNNPINWNTVKPSNSPLSDYQLNMNMYTQGLSCYSNSDANVAASVQNQNAANTTTWKPYDITKITEYYNMLSNQVSQIFGWDVDYHLTDPDRNGIDMILHEYQLKNIIDIKTIRVIVPENKFPENQPKINTFNLDLFDKFEIHILKDEFKNKFGAHRRPSEDDILFFCPLNRLYIVSSANVFRDVMNAGIYYKILLEKYEQKANINNLSAESKFKLDGLTKNTTLDELFGVEINEESTKIANKEQFKPFTFDQMRYSVDKKVIRVREDIYNGNINYAINYYNFKDIINKQAVLYKKTDNNLKVSDNRSFIMWFNFNNLWDNLNPNRNAWKNYNIDQNFNFQLLNNFDDTNKLGYRLWYFKKDINFQINNSFYKLPNLSLLTNIWYGLVVMLDQRQRVIEMKLYQRDNDYNITFMNPVDYKIDTISWMDTTGYTALITAGYKPVNNTELHSTNTIFKIINETYYDDFEPYEFSHNVDIQILGSDIKYTNLRILTDVIPTDEINNTLNQNIIINADKLILADNADKNIYAENFVNNNWV